MRHAPPHPALSLFSVCGKVETVIPRFFFLFVIVIGSFLNVLGNFPGLSMGTVFAFRVPSSDTAAGSFFYLLGLHNFHLQSDLLFNVMNAVLGALVGSLLLWGAAAVCKLVRKQEGMGMGDVKMMAMVGSFLGPRGAFLTVLLGTLLGSVIAL